MFISTKPLKTAVVVVDGINSAQDGTFERWVLYSLLCASFAYCVRREIFG